MTNLDKKLIDKIDELLGNDRGYQDNYHSKYLDCISCGATVRNPGRLEEKIPNHDYRRCSDCQNKLDEKGLEDIMRAIGGENAYWVNNYGEICMLDKRCEVVFCWGLGKSIIDQSKETKEQIAEILGIDK